METSGWRFSDIPADELWAPSFTGLRAFAFVKKFAKSNPRSMIIQIKENRSHFMLAFGPESCIIKVADRYKLSEGNTSDLAPERSETQLLKVCLHYAAAEFARRRPLLVFVHPNEKPDSELLSAEQCDSDTLTATVTPDLLFVEGPDATGRTRELKEASLMALLRLDCGKCQVEAVHDLTVDRSLQSILAGVFYNCTQVHIVQ
ncbi:hypothetical protein B0H16DRAFT_1018799 [Mycena metata]|uniref:Uncharacterized protein n=1 Tax=Mycena metata TaxID=1033252 RepID=A0AAD7N2I6_9AGAR|nr:hypothetical protein B0H16DRAFT_1018799 [Mycena metata]